MAKRRDLASCRRFRGAVAELFKGAGGTLVGIAATPDRGGVSLMGYLGKHPVALPITALEALQNHDLELITALVRKRIGQAQLLLIDGKVSREKIDPDLPDGAAGGLGAERRGGRSAAEGDDAAAQGAVDGVSGEDRERLLGG